MIDEDHEYPPPDLQYPMPADNVTGIQIGDHQCPDLELPQHLAAALEVVPLERCFVTEDADGFGAILRSHARLMMERDLKGLKLCDE